jgi:hypothetical protein
VPNEYSARAWRASYPDARVEVVGCPKLDDLPAARPTRARRRDQLPLAGLRRARGRHGLGHYLPASRGSRPVPRDRPRAPEGRLARADRASTARRDRVRARLRRGLPARRRLRLRQQLDAVRVRRDRPPGRRAERARSTGATSTTAGASGTGRRSGSTSTSRPSSATRSSEALEDPEPVRSSGSGCSASSTPHRTGAAAARGRGDRAWAGSWRGRLSSAAATRAAAARRAWAARAASPRRSGCATTRSTR